MTAMARADIVCTLTRTWSDRNQTPRPRRARCRIAGVTKAGPDIVPIPGTKHASRLEENVGAVDVALDPDDVRRIAEAVPAGAAAGTRYPEAMMRALYL
ncbi:MAG: hypothetical protein HYU42_04235 [Candidatus Rokubacteria bacterium]|nr:hypothetical protein [Candidatus Rokubacteria bacterium]